VLVYSQFREVEGLQILSLALNENEYSEFKIKKNQNNEWIVDIHDHDKAKKKYIIYDSSDEEKTSLLLNIFNSNFQSLPWSLKESLQEAHNSLDNRHGEIIKMIMVSQSGAEGISLRNVRQVHVMEPYWNEIRIQQVIGRAVRLDSHIDLPENERKVDAFIYIMTLTEDQKKRNKVDDGLTADEMVNIVAKKKSAIIDGFISSLKKASIDCFIHGQDSCFAYNYKLSPNDLAYQTDWGKKINDTRYYSNLSSISTLDNELKLIKVTYDNNQALLIKNNNLLIDKDIYEKMKRFKVIGKLEENNHGTRCLRLFVD